MTTSSPRSADPSRLALPTQQRPGQPCGIVPHVRDARMAEQHLARPDQLVEFRDVRGADSVSLRLNDRNLGRNAVTA